MGLAEWSKIGPPVEWSGQLAYSEGGERWAERMYDAKRRGRPWGDGNFVREISELAGRDLGPGPRGRSQGNGRSKAPIADIVTAG